MNFEASMVFLPYDDACIHISLRQRKYMMTTEIEFVAMVANTHPCFTG